MRTDPRHQPGVLAALVVSAAIAGCSLGEGGSAELSQGTAPLAGVTGYTSANALITNGYSERELGPGHVLVKAKGSAHTPLSRIEKIALARAAEIGVEQKLKFFKAGPPTHSIVCTPAREPSHKGGKIAASKSPAVEIDVVYAKDQADPSYLSSADTFARLSDEIAAEIVPAQTRAAAAAAVEAHCGK